MKVTVGFTLVAGAIFALLSVVIGAFGAHALKPLLSVDMLAVFKTAVQYQMFHASALLITGLLMSQNMMSSNLKYLRISVILFMIGITLFSGSLYLLALTEIKIMGAVTPLGGVAFIAAWICFVIGARNFSNPN